MYTIIKIYGMLTMESLAYGVLEMLFVGTVALFIVGLVIHHGMSK